MKLLTGVLLGLVAADRLDKLTKEYDTNKLDSMFERMIYAVIVGLVVADRLDYKEFNLAQLDEEWEEDDDIDIDDLPHWDERRPKQGMDTTKLDGRDHITTWSESKKGQQFGMYVTTKPGLTQEELTVLFDIWQMNMLNCCNFELQFLPIEGSTMLVLLPDGKYLRDFAAMLRKDDKCYTFNVENTSMLCPGHPLWDPKYPGKNIEGIKWDKYHEEEARKKKRQQAEVWNEDDIPKSIRNEL